MDAVEDRPITSHTRSVRFSPEPKDFGGEDLDIEYPHVEERHDLFKGIGNVVGQIVYLDPVFGHGGDSMHMLRSVAQPEPPVHAVCVNHRYAFVLCRSLAMRPILSSSKQNHVTLASPQNPWAIQDTGLTQSPASLLTGNEWPF